MRVYGTGGIAEYTFCADPHIFHTRSDVCLYQKCVQSDPDAHIRDYLSDLLASVQQEVGDIQDVMPG